MVSTTNFLPTEDIDLNLRRRVIVHLKEPPSSNAGPDMRRSGLIQISSVKRLQRQQRYMIKDFKSWMMATSGKCDDALDEILQRETIKQKTFYDVDECLEYIRSTNNKCVILILSPYYGRNKKIISTFKEFRQIAVL